MILRQLETLAYSFNEFVWWIGKVEDVMDPNETGRVKVRVWGYYDDVPKDHLPWALCVHPITSAGLDGVGFSPTGIVVGSTVLGFFADGHDALTPLVFGTLGSNPTSSRIRYPSGESDVNRLARGVAAGTVVPIKEANRDMQVKEAFAGIWNEPPVPFASTYPDNFVCEGKGGHLFELDGSAGAERIHTYHSKGGFEEYHPSGDKVTKVVRDKYSITIGNDYCHIKGDASVTIDGNCSVLIEGNTFIEIKGDKNEKIHGDYNLEVVGRMSEKFGRNYETHTVRNKIELIEGFFETEVGIDKIELVKRNYTLSVLGYLKNVVKSLFKIDVCGGDFHVSSKKNKAFPYPFVVGDAPKCEVKDPDDPIDPF